MKKLRKLAVVVVAAALMAGIMPQATGAADARQVQRVPIFMYHTSSEYNPGRTFYELYIRPSEFERQVQHLVDGGYTFMTFDEWFDMNTVDRPVFITFDDGYETNYTEIFPIIKRHNVKITIFLETGSIGRRGRLSADMIRRMSDSGLVKFESHAVSHQRLTELSPEKLREELRESRRTIESITGRRVHAVAYPFGAFNEQVIAAAREYYQFGVAVMGSKHNTARHGNFEIRRMEVRRSTTMAQFRGMLAS